VLKGSIDNSDSVKAKNVVLIKKGASRVLEKNRKDDNKNQAVLI
jgi:hypothetical protein